MSLRVSSNAIARVSELTPYIPGLVSGFIFEQGSPILGPELRDDPSAWQHGGARFAWLHFSLADQCHSWIARNLQIPPPALEIFLRIDEHVRLATFDGGVCGIVPDFSREFDTETNDSVRLCFVLADGLLLTGRHKPVESVHKIRERLAEGLTIQSPAELLNEILQCFSHHVDTVADRLSDELVVIEDHVLDNRPVDESSRLAPLRQLAARQHRMVRTYRKAIHRFGHASLKVKGETTPAIRFPELAERLDEVDAEFDDIAARARLLHDEMIAKLANETNRILFFFSVLTAVFLPPTFVVGFFGMNFSWMPLTQVDGGVWIGTAICIATSAAVLVFLQRARGR